MTFKIHRLLVYSSATKQPKHRKFRFQLECVDETLKRFEQLHVTTLEFYVKARCLREKQEAEDFDGSTARKRKRGTSPSPSSSTSPCATSSSSLPAGNHENEDEEEEE